jgi:CDP-6-deoxy-D-xylo-4-hexulose-3-dehydrase
MNPVELKAEILRLTREYSRLTHAAQRPGNDPKRAPFEPGQTIPYAGRVFDEDEVEAAVSSTLDFWLTLGPEGEAMQEELADFLGVKHSLLVNSGSSANLVAISALTTYKLPDHQRILPGDEVITVAAGFPTTVAPILQVGAVPVFIDALPYTGNADCSQLEAAYSPGKTKAVMMAHALGNPFDIGAVLEFCKKYDLWLIEDNCDALGCTYSMPVEKARKLGVDHLLKQAEAGTHPLIRFDAADQASGDQSEQLLTAPTGSWGDISTQSFYPPHHLTMGEGGSVNIIRRAPLKTYAESFRDWGRDCWCPSGKDDTCRKRFAWQLGELPEGYDHKYIYSHMGFNLKPLDPQAAIGRVQLRKLMGFIEARKQNWEYLRRGLAGLEEFFDFALPTHATHWSPGESNFIWDSSGQQTDCSWFGFKITLKDTAPFSKTELVRYLDEHKIGNRMLFGGNLVRQPAFVRLRAERPDAFRVIGDLPIADRIMKQTFFLGTYPGLTKGMMDYECDTIKNFVKSR